MAQSIASRNAGLDAINALLDGGTIEFRSGAPGAVDSAPTGTLLATFDLEPTAFTAASNGSASLVLPPPATYVADGTVGHFVAKDSLGNVMRNGTVGESGSGATVIGTTDAVTGNQAEIQSWVINKPA